LLGKANMILKEKKNCCNNSSKPWVIV